MSGDFPIFALFPIHAMEPPTSLWCVFNAQISSSDSSHVLSGHC